MTKSRYLLKKNVRRVVGNSKNRYQGTDLNAMKYLLQSFPGRDAYHEELCLVKKPLNGMKMRVFNAKVTNLRSVKKWKNSKVNEKINELRDWLLLVRVGYSYQSYRLWANLFYSILIYQEYNET